MKQHLLTRITRKTSDRGCAFLENICNKRAAMTGALYVLVERVEVLADNATKSNEQSPNRSRGPRKTQALVTHNTRLIFKIGRLLERLEFDSTIDWSLTPRTNDWSLTPPTNERLEFDFPQILELDSTNDWSLTPRTIGA